MRKYLVSINDLPPDGKEFTLDDQEIWLKPLEEFHMECRIERPLKASITVQPAEEGCLVRGRLTGAVVVPCNRCAEDAGVAIDTSFDEFEEIPPEEKAAPAGAAPDGESHVVYDRHAPMLDLAAVCWEEFMLSLPVAPLCREECKGLCPVCGTNLNEGQCACEREDADPRMAPLRDLASRRQ
ncbi:MAG: DUF177 domain-containing protein [Desulfovibrio sp.]|nr:DUF177 domain-containing protein [Desulfovibrio sp.]